jgi:hypothetical protein
VILAVFVSAEPTIFSLPTRVDDFEENDATDNNNNAFSKWFWPVLMVVAQIPVAVNYVLYETGL